MVKAHKFLDEIESYIPGRSKIGDKKYIKLSSNENALGSSKIAIEAYKKHSLDLFRYADGSCQELREKIAQKNNLISQNIVCGAGSDEIIALLTSAFAGFEDEIIYSEHGFLMYPISAQRVGAKAVKAKEINLKTDINSVISLINKKTKIIFLAIPNNPTGSYLTKSEVDLLISKTPKNILIVLDGAYEEFVQKDDYPNLINLVEKNENVVMTRTFSKIFGLASLRIGWSYSSKYVADILNKVRGPFNVCGAAQAAAIAALEDDEFLEKSKDHNNKWLKIFFDEVKNYEKIKLHDSVANFILFDFFKAELAQKANENFIDSGFILRDMKAYSLSNTLRMTIGNNEENEKILEFLKNYK